MINLNLLGAEVLSTRNLPDHIEFFWDNYDLIIWENNPNGYFNTKGMFRKNKWGITKRFSPNNNGIWKIPYKYVKYLK